MEQFDKQDENAIERIERLENDKKALKFQLDRALEKLDNTAQELQTFKEPIRVELINLLNYDINVKHLLLDLAGLNDFRTTIENEVDEQVSHLKDDVLDEVDCKLEDKFYTDAFRLAVDEHMRRKF